MHIAKLSPLMSLNTSEDRLKDVITYLYLNKNAVTCLPKSAMADEVAENVPQGSSVLSRDYKASPHKQEIFNDCNAAKSVNVKKQ